MISNCTIHAASVSDWYQLHFYTVLYLHFVQVGVIDFSMYLKNDIDDYRSEERYDLSSSPSAVSHSLSSSLFLCCFIQFYVCFRGNRNSQIASILDQKNYVEELNRQLK